MEPKLKCFRDLRTGRMIESCPSRWLVEAAEKNGGVLNVVQYTDGGVSVIMVDDGDVEEGYTYRGRVAACV